MVTVVCSVATGAPRMRLLVAGHSRTMAYTASALDVYLAIKEKQSYGHWFLYNKEKKLYGKGQRLNKWKKYREP